MTRTTGACKRAKGFTLLESVVAIFMVMMGVCTFGSLAVLSRQLSIQTQFRNAALSFARQELEVVSTASYSKLTPGSRVTLAVPSDILATLPVAEAASYKLAAEYIVEPGPSPTVRQVTVHVWWRNKLNSKGANTAAISELRLSQFVAMQPPDPALK